MIYITSGWEAFGDFFVWQQQTKDRSNRIVNNVVNKLDQYSFTVIFGTLLYGK